MAQQQQRRFSGGEQAWLASLVKSFETVSCEPQKIADAGSIAKLKSQLARPAAATIPVLIALH